MRAGSGAAPEAYAYDAAGNVLSMPGLSEGAALGAGGYATAGGSAVVLDTGNRVYRANGEQFAYDDRDHVSARMRWDGVATRYGYDSLDRLVSVDAPGMAWRAKHDALGRRTEVTCNGRVRRQYWDTDRLAAEHFDDGRVRVYVYADAHALVPLLSVDYASLAAAPESGVVHAWFTSHQGAPEEVTQLDGTLVWSGRVAPFGAVEVTHGADFHQPLRWPGHYYDADTGLHYNRFREYDPRLGRYLQSDPQGISGGDNLYAYAWDDNPLRSVDVRGLACPGDGGDGANGEDGVEGEGTAPLVRRDDRPYSPEGRRPGTRKSHVDAEGRLVPANPDGQATVQQHVRGADPAKSDSPYTSFSGGSGTPKSYGEGIIELDAIRLRDDIRAGRVEGCELIENQQVMQHLDQHVAESQARYDANPTAKNERRLTNAKLDRANAARDNEVLVRGVVPSEYVRVQ